MEMLDEIRIIDVKKWQCQVALSLIFPNVGYQI